MFLDRRRTDRKKSGKIPQGAVFVNGTLLLVYVGESPNLNFRIFNLYNWDEGMSAGYRFSSHLSGKLTMFQFTIL